jgi:hypothetical protein
MQTIQEPIEININDCIINFKKSNGSNYLDLMQIKKEFSIGQEMIEKIKCVTVEFLSFMLELNSTAGKVANKFVNSYYRIIGGVNLINIYNGEDFTVPYEFIILNEDNLVIHKLMCSGNDGAYILDKQKVDNIVKDLEIIKYNITDECIRYANIFLEYGYFDMAIMNISMAMESFIKNFVLSNGVLVHAFI